MNDTRADVTPDKSLAAVCGLFCPACGLYIASMKDRGRLQVLADRFKMPQERVECHGCRSDKRGFFCEDRCTMTRCAAEKGVEFCGECPDYPCEELRTFQAQLPHRLELWDSQERIVTAGWETWFAEMVEHYSCPACGTMNSAYDRTCRSCGTTPSCRFVELHGDDVDRNPVMRL